MVGAVGLVFVILTAANGTADEQKISGNTAEDEFVIEDHFFAQGVYFDRENRCRATNNTKLKSWFVPGFPAEIPHFESCTTLSSKTARGKIKLKFSIVDKSQKPLLEVSGVVNLGKDGVGSQAIDWEQLMIPSPGSYFMLIFLEDSRKLISIPMTFQSKPSKKKSTG